MIFLGGRERKSLQGYKTAGFKMADTSISMPGGFGGLMRYNEEYDTKFSLKPMHVVVFVILIIAFRVVLPALY